jgi:hypothetical protein
LTVAKLATLQVNKLPLEHKISKIDMICFAKPGLTEELYIVHSAKGRIFNNMLYVRYVHFTKDQTYS